MIVLKSSDEVKIMREANQIVAEVMDCIETMIKPGVTTIQLDIEAEELIKKRGGKPAFKGYLGYKHTLCTSVTQFLLHPHERTSFFRSLS